MAKKRKQIKNQSEITNNASDAEFGVEFTESKQGEKKKSKQK
ncbi:hypothetical protein [Alkalihalobacterium elongatum]|nr:hypothetical protein [Alkalihalobacterium elongatum]